MYVGARVLEKEGGERGKGHWFIIGEACRVYRDLETGRGEGWEEIE